MFRHAQSAAVASHEGAPRGGAAGAGVRGPAVTTALRASVMTAIVLIGALVAAQTPFRVTYTVKARTAPAFLLEGRVSNETGREVVDVWVTAEALNASGKVLATGIAFVGPSIGRGSSAGFLAKVPFVEGAESFRIAVTSFRPGSEVQSP